jgi:CheY-like chemotaxis protein
MARLVPVILIVEDEFLLRLDSAATIEHAGFEVIQAANADEAIAILNARPCCLHQSSDVGFDGRAEARPFRPQPLAADQNRCDFGTRGGGQR